MMNQNFLAKADPAVLGFIEKEENRQLTKLEMIASENFTSPAVCEAVGSVLTNKYAEGYPGKRYYGGCEFVDEIEALAIERAKKIFGAEHANVQPHSGSQANMAAYMAVLNPGDSILGHNLSEGGHLTHGSPVNFSGQIFKAYAYGLNPETGLIDFNQVREMAKKHQPKLIVCGASAYPRQIDFATFREIANEVGAYLLADIAHPAGLVAKGEHPDPMPYCDFVTTTTHKTLRGPRGGMILCKEEHAKAVNKKIFPGIQGGPLMHVIAGKAVAFLEVLSPLFKDYAKQVIANAKVLAGELTKKDYHLVSGGTDNHLLLIDLTKRNLSGKDAEAALETAGITVNKNTVPNETRSPFVTSGIRIGTPALTTRGFKEEQMVQVASWIDQALTNYENESELIKIAQEVSELAQNYPLFKA